ncbi:MFS transporter [Dankookia rubra]|uniref:MFS transporter n=1 Tax=Dankookia rubra TaxID=1442381 RepID=A0A4R5QAN9_9PROT|nr:MFS transporter [Dankookia rubra]TDH59753.1 MFS transporter [Dankookia rubra]
MPQPQVMEPPAMAGQLALHRTLLIGSIAFLTLVDLFAAQAILPSLAGHYGVSPAEMGTAVNATTLGMAVAALGVALIGRRVPRRRAILASLLLLAAPTALLSAAPDLPSFAVLRVVQGLCMATAFTLTLAHLGERCAMGQSASAFAAYVTGNVASNLVGRLGAAALVDHVGLPGCFLGFALLNLVGAALVHATIDRAAPTAGGTSAGWAAHLSNPVLLTCFAIGFCILFAFVGTFTYVNFVLTGPAFGLTSMQVGLTCLVFLPSVATTPLAGRIGARFGAGPVLVGGLVLAVAGLPLLLLPRLIAVASGMVLVAAGTFLAQAIATGLVGRIVTHDRAAASGMYLAAYFAGGLVGSAMLGQAFQHFGWLGCVAGIGAALGGAVILGLRMRL